MQTIAKKGFTNATWVIDKDWGHLIWNKIMIVVVYSYVVVIEHFIRLRLTVAIETERPSTKEQTGIRQSHLLIFYHFPHFPSRLTAKSYRVHSAIVLNPHTIKRPRDKNVFFYYHPTFRIFSYLFFSNL